MVVGATASADLIRLAYEGVHRKDAWQEMLSLACHVFRSQDSYFARIPVQREGPRFVMTHGVDPKVAAAYRDAWVAPPRNPVMSRLYRAKYNGILDVREVLPNCEFERTEFFDVVRRPRGVYGELGCGNIGAGGEVRFFAVNRARGDPAYGATEKRLMSVVYPHWMHALSLEEAVSAEKSRTTWTRRALDTLDDPVIRRDPDGRLRALNPAGEAFLRAEGIGAFDLEAMTGDPRPSRRDDSAPRLAGAAGPEKTFRSGRRYQLFATPVFESDMFRGEIVRLRRKDAVQARPSAGWTGALTPQEREVAARLCEGRTSADICSRLGITVNTLNTHVRHLLEKANCHSRLQLVTLLTREASGG